MSRRHLKQHVRLAAEARENKKRQTSVCSNLSYFYYFVPIEAETYEAFCPLGLKLFKQIGVHKFSCNKKCVPGRIFAIDLNDLKGDKWAVFGSDVGFTSFLSIGLNIPYHRTKNQKVFKDQKIIFDFHIIWWLSNTPLVTLIFSWIHKWLQTLNFAFEYRIYFNCQVKTF